MSAHTPGPWIHKGHHPCTIHRDLGEHGHSLAIARVMHPDNGPLVAAAPELKNALLALLKLWDENHPESLCGCVGASDDCKYPPPCEPCQARAALVKSGVKPKAVSR